MAKKELKLKFDIRKHILVPKHTKLSDKDKKKLLEKFNITHNELPRISPKDPAIIEMKLKTGDVIRIERDSRTTSKSIFYRAVI